MPTIDDFEDGDVAGWGGDTGTLSATTDALSGSHSGQFVRGASESFAEVQSPSVAPADYTTLKARVAPDQIDGDATLRITPRTGGTELGRLFHAPNGTVNWEGPTGSDPVTIGSFSFGAVYDYEIECDPASNTATVRRDGATLATDLDLRADFGDGITEMAVAIDGLGDTTTSFLRFDDIIATDSAQLETPAPATVSLQDSGDLLVEWDGTPLADNYEIEVSEDGGAFRDVTTVSSGTTSTTVAQTSGVIEYRFRVRGTAGSRTSDWAETSTLNVGAAPPQTLSATPTGTESIDLSWTPSASDVDGHRVIRETQQAGAFQPTEVIADLSGSAGSYSDIGLYPGRTYRYRIEAYAGDVTSQSDAETATTDDLGLPRERVPSEGWYVEIDDPDTGQPLVPTILEGTQPEQSLNDTPQIEVHVPPSDRWDAIAEQRPPMRVWRDGERQPIERFEGPQTEPEKTILYGRGGVELDEDIEVDVGATTDVDDFVRSLVGDETPYAKTVDDPANNIRDDVRVLAADTVASYQNVFQEVEGQTGNDIPVGIRLQPSRLVTEQVVWLQSSDEAFEQSTLVRLNEPETYWRGRAHELNGVGDTLAWEIETRHTFDASELELRIRKEQPLAGQNPEIEVRFDGTVVETISENLDGSGGDAAPTWFTIFAGNNLSGPIEAGTHEIRLTVTPASSDNDVRWIVDGVGAHDTRYPADWALGDGAGGIVDGVLQGPGLYPESVEVTTEVRSTIEQVVGGRATVALNNTSGQQALAITNDGGQTSISASNTEEVVGSFGSSSTQIQATLTLSRYDADPTTSPAIGDGRQSLSSIEVFANLDDTPFVANTAYDGSVADVLTELAETYGFVWALEWDEQAEAISVEWTQPGQREATSTAPVLDYQTETNTETLAEKAIVYGRSRRVEETTITIATDTFESVGDGYVQPGTVRVVDPDTDVVYRVGDDYEVLHNEGVLRATPDGNIDDGQDVLVSFDTRLRAEYELPDADGTGDTVRSTIESATTGQLAQQAAKAITNRLAQPRRSAEVTLDRTATFDLVGALSVDGPIDPQVVSKLSRERSKTTVLLGDRRTEDKVIADVRSRLESIASAL